MFRVRQGSPCTVIRPDGSEVQHITRRESLFDLEELVADPICCVAPAVGNLYGFVPHNVH